MKTSVYSVLGATACYFSASLVLAQQQNVPGPVAGTPPAVNQNAAGHARAQAIGSTAPQAARAGQTFQGDRRFDRTVLGRNNLNQNGQFDQNGRRVDSQGRPIEAPPNDGTQPDGSFDPGFSGGASYVSVGGGPATAYGAAVIADAEVIRSMGEFNRSSAQAMIHQEKAREMNIDNRSRAVSAYFSAREINREMRSNERGPVASAADLIRYNKQRTPERLSSAELDRQIGEIHWPAVLLRSEFDDHRGRLAELFADRGYYNSGLASTNYVSVKDEADRMLDTLQSLVYDIEPQSYVQAKKFISSLSYEARFVATADEALAG
jgi:hypothetical protein